MIIILIAEKHSDKFKNEFKKIRRKDSQIFLDIM
jgi:hypothetical protein